MEEQEVRNILNEVGAVLTDDHFVLNDGHSSSYVNKDAIFPHTAKVSALCRGIAEQFVSDKVEVVIAPAIGAIALSQWAAHNLGWFISREVLAVYAEKRWSDSTFHITRGYDKLVTNKNVLVIEDILTTGSSIRDVVRCVRDIGGNVVGVGAICNRGGVTPAMLGDVPKLISLLNLPLERWEEKDCPLCARNVPVNEGFGRGREFMERK